MTGFYMFRLMGKTFYGESHVDPHVEPNVHESPWTHDPAADPAGHPGGAARPGGRLAARAQACCTSGWGPSSSGATRTLGRPAETPFEFARHRRHAAHHRRRGRGARRGRRHLVVRPLPRRASGARTVERLTKRLRPLYRASFAKWWFDDLNDLIFVRFGGRVARSLWWFDVRVVDGTVNGIAALTQGTGRGIRQIQTGRVQNYALGIAAGLLVIAVTYIFVTLVAPMIDTMRSLPLLVAGHLHAARRARSWSPSCPRSALNWIRWAALGHGPRRLGCLAAAAGRLRRPAQSGFQFGEVADWVPAFGIQYKLGVDGISIALVVLTTTLTWISILASFAPIKERVKEYMISFLILEVGMIGVFLALDMFLFYIFWELVLIPMYLIIGIWGGANRIYATIKFVLYTLVGSLLMLVAILAMAYTYQATTGSWVGAFDYEKLHDVRLRPNAPVLRVRRLLPGVRDQGAHVPVPYLAARCARGGTDRGLGHPGRACCSSWAATACCALRCRSSRRPRTTGRR